MDVVTQSLLKEFADSQKIDGLAQPAQFEAFVNYIVVSDIYPEEFDFNLVATGSGEFGIDGIAMIVNDAIVDDEEQLEDVIAHSPVLQVQFFVRAGEDQFVVRRGRYVLSFSMRCSTSLPMKRASDRMSAYWSFSASKIACISPQRNSSVGCPRLRFTMRRPVRGPKTRI